MVIIFMNKDYEKIVKLHQPKEEKMKMALMAFLSGGVMGLLGEGLIRLYICIFALSRNDASMYMIVTFIFLASLFTALGFLIPITGFAHSMTSAGLDYKNEGLVYGIGSNVFKLAGTVIFYGVVSAWFFGLVRYLWEVLI